ncbi:4-hydroxybutyrate CoA-transferase [Dethiosulfatibacter aminovorans DSM 17477]|uniref:4-hydroxybutyrate CoA-transferase n=1 Tax=Dethiosulfatibacter aminovorans DSM 17477 TaxID=1121476 RepID=A0A1M6ENJ9_9FIRM|nr:acetyl-CoA hydrolase/transferase C-terminal domain-containing protein [Dethiosulfatibacter aminovorans]SHI86993.1 4-hydroxybutyrate CoA-transferase [Dethiosulfatibacter aminovorans DSM 17477]
MKKKGLILNRKNWRDVYKDKIITTEEAAKIINNGDKIVVQQTHLISQGILDAVAARAHELKDVEFFGSTTVGRADYLKPEYKDSFKYRCIFLDVNSRIAYPEGRASLVPCHYSQLNKYLEQVFKPNVLIVTLSQPDENGMTSMSLNVDYTEKCIELCDVIIGQINPYAPKTVGSEISLDKITWLVEHAEPLPELPPGKMTEVEEAIGSYIAPYIHDRDCIQVGIGGVPDAVLASLYDKKDLGVHSEVFGDGIVDLYERGIINGKYKQLDVGKIVANCVYGTRKVIDFVDNNPDVMLKSVEYTNNPYIISQNDNMVSINAALQLDLFGQIVADTLNGKPYSGIGGQVDFVRGATMSKNGRSFITLPSTAKKGQASRIIPALPAGTPVTTSRYDVQYVVTEFGAVNLWGLSTRDRAEAIISIAHPDFKEELRAQAKQIGLVL